MAEVNLRKGDIVRNVYAGENNPNRYLLYLGKRIIRQGRYRNNGYDCLAFDGRRVQLFQSDNPLEYVGHMDEFDAFVDALQRLREVKDG